MSFQIFLIVVFGLVGLGSIVAMVRGVSIRLGLVTLLVAAAGCAAAIWPDLTTQIARAVGIERGTDLIVYCAVITMMAGFFLFYIRLRQMRRELTLMVRHVALMEAHERPPSPRAGSIGSSNHDEDAR